MYTVLQWKGLCEIIFQLDVIPEQMNEVPM